jgi:diguanylate cyclase (GGDEF)-like protein
VGNLFSREERAPVAGASVQLALEPQMGLVVGRFPDARHGDHPGSQQLDLKKQLAMQDFLTAEAPPSSEKDAVSLDEAFLLIEEIRKLRAQLEGCKSQIDELNHLAHWDPVVDLPNRRSFLSALDRLVARTLRHGGHSAMLFVDVDGLKAINDKFGHDIGDKALSTIARLLVSGVRKSDFVARLSGDEFGILLDEADELAAWQTALRLIEIVDESHLCMNGFTVPLSIAVGVAVIRPEDTPETVFTRADQEMYRIKVIGAPPGTCPPARHFALFPDRSASLVVQD